MTFEQRIKNMSVPEGMIDVVLDTDAYNEIDDQFALSFMMKVISSPSISQPPCHRT